MPLNPYEPPPGDDQFDWRPWSVHDWRFQTWFWGSIFAIILGGAALAVAKQHLLNWWYG